MKQKKTITKKFLAVFLTLAIVLQGIMLSPSSAEAMTTQSEAVNWIRSQKGKAIDMDGYYGAQCVDLIAAYFEYLGVSWRSMTVSYAKDYTWRSLPSGWQRIQGASVQAGDIVIWTGGTTGHVALALSGDRIVEQNWNSRMYCVENSMHWSNYWGVIRPNFNPEAPAGSNPIGCFDNAEGGINTVRVRGWAFDPDDKAQQIQVHVYIGGPAGVGEGHAITANILRKDVDDVYKSGAYHGFDATIRTAKTGTQTIYVYAINIGGGNDNPQIGTKTVTISKDSTPPVISDVQVVDMDATGYTVTCKAEDAEGIAKVQFPTWTAANDQDDLASDWQNNPSCSGKQDGTTWSFRVNDGEHNYERGIYHTHIYAWDNNGNVTSYGVNNIVFQNMYSHVNTAYYNGHTYYLYNDCLTWYEARIKCEDLGGHLVTITSAEEQKTVSELIQGQARVGYWIGGSSENGGTWVNGEEFTYSNWEPGEPNADGREDCYEIYTNKGTWNDLLGSKQHFGVGFICEWDEEKADASNNPVGPSESEPEKTKEPETSIEPSPTVPGETMESTPEPTDTVTPSETPISTPKPNNTVTPSETPISTPKPSVAVTQTQTPISTPKPTDTATPSKTPGSTQTPPAATAASTPKPTAAAVPTKTTEEANTAQKLKKLKLSSFKYNRESGIISGKVSVSKVVVKIKAGKSAYKKATVKGRKFTLKTSSPLKKNTKISIQLTKKGYKKLVKEYKIK